MKKEGMRKKYGSIVITFLCAFLFAACLHATRIEAANYENAVTLPLNGDWSPIYELANAREEQWYKVVLPGDGKFSFTVMSYAGIFCQWYTEDLTSKLISCPPRGTEVSPETLSRSTVLSKGTYYLRVRLNVNSSTVYKYKMKVGFTNYHTNNAAARSYDSPQTVSLNSKITGAFTMTTKNKEDWYRIVIPRKGKYNFVFSANSGIDPTLYDEDLLQQTGLAWEIHYASENSPLTRSEAVTLDRGTYYLKVCRFSSSWDYGKYSFTVKPTGDVAATRVSSISISGNKRVTAGKSFTLKAVIKPSTATNKKVTWTSSNTKVATVNSSGKVMTKRAGVTKITVKAQDGSGKKKSCTVIVLPKKITSLKISSPRKKQLKIQWSKRTGPSGYQVQYAINNKFTRSVTTENVKNTTSSILIKNISSKKYYVRIRACVKSGSKVYYGPWSTVKSIKVK